MNSKILPSIIMMVLAICFLHNSYLVKQKNTITKTGQTNIQHTNSCPAAAPACNAEKANSTVKEAMSSYPSIMYVDM